MPSPIIPMLVEAFASGRSRPVQKDVPVMSPNYKTALATSVLGSLNTPGTAEKAKPLKPGVHLHFILPDAFTHSVDNAGFPAVPNRYTVTRLWRDAAPGKISVRCFVIESDFISTDAAYADSITIPFFQDPDNRKKWRYLGRFYPAETPPPAGGAANYLDKLTAAGAGDPLFAAYYPNCRSVFGFHDSLADLRDAPMKLTYFVTGHFSAAAADPFSRVKTADDFSGVLGAVGMGIRALVGETSEKSTQYEGSLRAFRQTLPAGVTCEKSGSEAFHAPKDPVVLLSGPGINRTFAFGEDGRFSPDGSLPCQTEPLSADIGKDDVFNRCLSASEYLRNLPGIYSDMLLQTLLAFPETLATVESIAGKVAVKGDAPGKIAINTDPFNWTTLCMIWGVDYLPTGSGSGPDDTLAGWALEYGETNLVYKGGLEPGHLKKHHMAGRTVLTPHAVKTLGDVVKRYGDIYGDEKELRELGDKIKDLHVISQNLRGFSEYFSGFRPALQFPVFGIGESRDITDLVAEHVGDGRQSILPDGVLLPMRGGYVRVTDLALVGSFGQTPTLAESSYHNKCEVDFAESVRCDAKGHGLLPAAFAAPTRLNLAFISAADNALPASPAPGTSPSCGILVPETLNRRLLAYAADGEYLGMVKTVRRNRSPAARWLSRPGLARDFGDLDISDKRLEGFLAGLLGIDGAFHAFNSLVDKFLDVKQHQAFVVWGRPLVLARARVKFEFFAQPQFSRRYGDFQKHNTRGAEEIRFHLGFGDIERVTDGLLGCYDDTDFTRLFPPFGARNPCATEGYVRY